MEENIEINIDNIVDNHYDNTPMIDTNEDSDDVFDAEVPENLEHLSPSKIKMLKHLFRGGF